MKRKSVSIFINQDDLNLQVFEEICTQEVKKEDFPLAEDVRQNIIIYDGAKIRALALDEKDKRGVKNEFAYALKDGPGVFIIKAAYPDLSVIERSTELFRKIVTRENKGNHKKGDHFGENERIWNSFQKMCLSDPELFISYFGNPILALVFESWLGPNYRITAQMNNVKPGNKAQSPHRDYHLGFQSVETTLQYPIHAQVMSQFLTLQGAIVHSDMPIEKGPTLFLPFSHQFREGYLSFRLPHFTAYFENNKVQIPFEKGDMVFFNPALYHAGGSNSTLSDRVANLLQVSSSFGQTMEAIDNLAMIKKVYPILLKRQLAGNVSPQLTRDVIAAISEGYSFPTNLDSDPPIGGLAPDSQKAIVSRGLEQKSPLNVLLEELSNYERRRMS